MKVLHSTLYTCMGSFEFLFVCPSLLLFSVVNCLVISFTGSKSIYIRDQLLPHRERYVSHPVFKAKTRCSSYVCTGSSCHTYGQNVSTEYQCLYYIVSYYKNLLQVQKGLNSGMDPILPQAVDRGFHTPRRNLHQCTPHPLSSRT
jgi:hypothetical protein